MFSFGQGRFMVSVEGHPKGEEQKAAGCLLWSSAENSVWSGAWYFDSRTGIINSSLQIKLSEVKQLVHRYLARDKGLELR